MNFRRLCRLFIMFPLLWHNAYSSKMRSAKKDGDIILGGLFPIHRPPHNTIRYTRSCGEIWEQYGIHRIEMMLLTIDRINNDMDILPNVTLGWDIRDSCWYSPIAMEQGIDFIKDSIASVDKSTRNASNAKDCGSSSTNKPVAGLIGPGSSENTIQVQGMLQMFNIPQIGYSATSIDLSNKNLYKYFVRVVPSDKYQAQAMLDVVIRFNWTYVSTVHSDGNYGEKGFEVFRKLAVTQGVCLATNEAAPGLDDPGAYDEIVRKLLRTNSSRVVICICEGMTVRRLLQATWRIREARNYFQIFASDGWADRPDVVEGIEEIAVGGISMKLLSNHINSFDSYFLSLRPENNFRNPWFQEFWQWKFGCYLDWLPISEQYLAADTSCNGDEYITHLKQDAKLEFVVKAVYALAHALHNLHQDVCNGLPGICSELEPVSGEKLLNYLMNVSFSLTNREEVFFDGNGDPPPRYDIVNFQRHHSTSAHTSYQYIKIGEWKSGELLMNDSEIYWRAGEVAKSICSEECERGSVKKIHGNVPCCWVCTQCKENQIVIDSEDCRACNKGWWPNENLTECLKIRVEYISWFDTEAIVVLITASCGILVTVWVIAIFYRHNNTPVVKASTRELSYIILFGVLMAYSSNYVLVAKPALSTCYLTRIIPGLSFSLIYGALVTKTNRIARILEGTKKIITKKPRFMSASAQVIFTCIIIGVECTIITVMLVIEPADCKLYYPDLRRVKLICNTTTVGIIVPLGFDLFLIIICTLYAVKTRNLPENFNEAKFIGFSMYTTCVIWLGFIAIYFGSERQVIIMAVSVSLSASVALVLLFFPKLYVIVWVPEKNTRSAFTTSKDIRCHIGSISCPSGESIDIDRFKTNSNDFDHMPRRRSLLARFKRGRSPNPALCHRKNMTVPRMTSNKLHRDNSIHVHVTPLNDKSQKFPWAKISEDRLSSISSMEDIDKVNNGQMSNKKQDLSTQTDTEMLRSILQMPYIRRRNGKKIERTSAIDDSVGFNNNVTVEPWYQRKSPSSRGNSSETINAYIRSNSKETTQDRAMLLHPSYSDECMSVSDGMEGEDFQLFDSGSNLLQLHRPASVTSASTISNNSPVYVYGGDMRNNINPLLSNVNYSSNRTVMSNGAMDLKNGSAAPVQLMVESKQNGASTRIIKDPLRAAKSSGSLNNVIYYHNTHLNDQKSLSNSCLMHMQDTDTKIQACQTRRVSSPAISFISSRLPNSEKDLNSLTCKARDDSLIDTLPSDDITQRYIQTLDEEEISMLQFHDYMKRRGVNLDMKCFESSDV